MWDESWCSFQPLLGRFPTVSCFLHVWIMTHRGSLESQKLRNDFLTLFQTSICQLLSHLFFHFFQNWAIMCYCLDLLDFSYVLMTSWLHRSSSNWALWIKPSLKKTTKKSYLQLILDLFRGLALYREAAFFLPQSIFFWCKFLEPICWFFSPTGISISTFVATAPRNTHGSHPNVNASWANSANCKYGFQGFTKDRLTL